MKRFIRTATATALGLVSASAFSQAAFYNESITLPVYADAAGTPVVPPIQAYLNTTPHTGSQTQTYTYKSDILGESPDGNSTQSVTFDSNPAPYVLATTTASLGASGLPVYSAVGGKLSYGFQVSGNANSFVDVLFRGNFDIGISNRFSGAYLGMTVLAGNTSAMEFTAIDQVGMLVRCAQPNGVSKSACSSDTSLFPTQTGSISLGQGPLSGINSSVVGEAVAQSFSGSIRISTNNSGRGYGAVGLFAYSGSVSYMGDNGSGTGLQTSHAFIDPELTIDPEYLKTNPTASLFITPGVGNETVTVVPEPETYAMMLAGLGLMGAITRRRKAKQTA